MKRKFLGYFKKYKIQAILAPLFKLLEAGIDLLVPIVIKNVIDNGIKANDIDYIYNSALILIALACIGLFFSILGQFFAAKTAVGVSSSMKIDLFNKIQHLSFNEIDTLGASNLVNIMTSDMNQVQTGINMSLRLFLRSPFVVFGAAIMASFISPIGSLSFWISIPILSIIVFGIMLITLPKYKKVQMNVDDVLNSTKENLSGIRVIRAFGNEEDELEKYHNKTNELKRKQINVGNISALMNPLTLIIINVAICILIYIGALNVNTGSLTQGDVIALYNYMSQILVELIKLAGLIVTLTKALACEKRAMTILNMEITLKHSDNLDTNDSAFIVFDDVSLTYKNAKEESLSNISFKVNKGEIIGVIGGTGSGKSSLVNLIPHFYDATKGSIYIDGKNVLNYSDKELRDKVSIVLQKATLFKGTIKDNINWGNMEASDSELLNAIEIAQAKDVVNKKENGINSAVEQLGRNYSGGQKQRLSIARAIAKNSDILILDDSSSALDYETDSKLRTAIKSLNKTIFIVSQRTSSIMDANKIIVLDEGKMVGIGTHEELLKNNDVYKEIYYSQFEKEDK